MSQIRIATYNIHKFVGGDGKWDPERVTTVIRAMDADLVAVQEFTIRAGHDTAPSPRSFAADVGYDVIEHKTVRRNGKEQFNLLLTRRAVRNVRILSVKLPLLDERGAITADIPLGSRTLRVAATHLGLPPSARRLQLKSILEACRTDTAFVLMGDLNISLPWEPAEFLLRSAFPSRRHPATFPARWPMFAVDRILMRPNGVSSLRPFSEAGASAASDHLPLLAEIDL